MEQPTTDTPTLDGPATPWGHRPHLDGLRTIAVYAVVFYHGGIERIAGGFVGVDLFFVLSGYLVTMVILSDLAGTGTLRLTRFYARRARRLIPAAAVVVVVTAVAAVLVSSPIDRASMIDDARASSLWFANWHFIREANDYFAADGLESPFIHFWSLSIEEQFYVAFPVVVLITWKLTGRLAGLMAVASAGFAASVVAQLYWAGQDANRAYLGTDARIYQILAGSLLAMSFWRWNVGTRIADGPTGRRATGAVAVAALAAFALVASSVLDVSASARGMLATVTSVLLISALELGRSGHLARLLATRPMSYLGQISYGTYLWHWPVLVLTLRLLDMPAVVATTLAAVAGTLLAAASAVVVEQPIRRRGRLDRVPLLVIAGGIGTAVVSGVLIAPALLQLDRKPVVVADSGRTGPSDSDGSGDTGGPVPDLDWSAIEEDRAALPPCEREDGSDCFVVDGDRGTILLVGDSHARMMIPPFAALARERGMSLAIDYSPSCPWQQDLLAVGAQERFTERCRTARTHTYERIIPSLRPELVVTAGFPLDVGGSVGAFTDRPEWADLTAPELVEAATRSSVAAIVDGGASVLMLENFPLLEANQLSCLSAATDVSQCVLRAQPSTFEDELFREVAAGHESAGSASLDLPTCPGLPLCDPIIGTHVVRRDAHHLTTPFAETLVPVLRPSLDDLLDR